MKRDSFDHRIHRVRTIPTCSWLPLGFKRAAKDGLEVVVLAAESLRRPVSHQNPIPRGMPWGKQSAGGNCNTHVLPWKPAYSLLEKSNRSHSILPPSGRMKLCCQLKKVPVRFPSSLTHHPPKRMQNMVCRTGTLRLQRERSDEVMQSTPMSQCRIPFRRQCYCPSC